MSIAYLYSKFIRKFFLGKSILNSTIDKTARVQTGSNVVNTSMGKYSYSSYDCDLINCEIGAFCSIADDVFIGGAEHPLNWISTSPVFENVKHSGPIKKFSSFDVPKIKKTIIGNDVWIGHRVDIIQGVKIGDGAVIAAGSVVTKDVEPYAIVGGCPARLIKYRFDKDIIDSLLELKWWDLDDDQLLQVAQYIKEPIKFISAVKSLKKE